MAAMARPVIVVVDDKDASRRVWRGSWKAGTGGITGSVMRVAGGGAGQAGAASRAKALMYRSSWYLIREIEAAPSIEVRYRTEFAYRTAASASLVPDSRV
jgi:hypothetical protein